MESEPSNKSSGRWNVSGFFRWLLITWLLSLAMFGILNFIVDPYEIYGSGLFPRVMVNFHDVKLEYFEQYDPPGESLIIGNSRANTLDPSVVEEITGERCFNFSFAGARTETYYSVLKIALEDNWPLNTVIVQVSPGCFHPTMPVEWETRFMNRIARNFIYHERVEPSWFELFGLLFTFDQTKQSLATVRRNMFAKQWQEPMETREDGYAIWAQREREIQAGTLNLEAAITRRIPKYPERVNLYEFDHISEVRMHYWEDFLDLCTDNDLNVIVFFAPLHPDLAEFLETVPEARILDDVVEYVEGTVTEIGGEFYNIRNIGTFGGSADGFYDEVHTRPINADAIIRYVLRNWNSEDE